MTPRIARLALLALCLLAHLRAFGGESNPLFYEVKSATTTVYLFGTIHVASKAMYPLNTKAQA